MHPALQMSFAKLAISLPYRNLELQSAYWMWLNVLCIPSLVLDLTWTLISHLTCTPLMWPRIKPKVLCLATIHSFLLLLLPFLPSFFPSLLAAFWQTLPNVLTLAIPMLSFNCIDHRQCTIWLQTRLITSCCYTPPADTTAVVFLGLCW